MLATLATMFPTLSALRKDNDAAEARATESATGYRGITVKTLFLMRHAKSDWSDSAQSDFDRPLNKRGRSDTPRMATLFGPDGAEVDFILSSAASRARQTAELLIESSQLDVTSRFDEQLYLADSSTLSHAVRSADQKWESGLVVAHNPGMEDWLADLSSCQLRFPTAALACVQLNVGHWSDIVEGCGQLQWFVTPRLLKSVL